MKNIRFELFKWSRTDCVFIKLGNMCVWAKDDTNLGFFSYNYYEDDRLLADSEILNCLSVKFITDIYKACYRADNEEY